MESTDLNLVIFKVAFRKGLNTGVHPHAYIFYPKSAYLKRKILLHAAIKNQTN